MFCKITVVCKAFLVSGFVAFWSVSSFASEKIAIIGGGLAGTIAGLHLAEQGVHVDIFESNEDIFRGSSAIPAHLYTGIMYADLGEGTVRHIMRDALLFAKNMPFMVNPSPTVMAIDKRDLRTPKQFFDACMMNAGIYQDIVRALDGFALFGNPKDFCRAYSHKELDELRKNPDPKNPWISNFARYTDYTNLKEPVLLVQEFGMDMRFGYGFIKQLIVENPRIRLFTNSKVSDISSLKDDNDRDQVLIAYRDVHNQKNKATYKFVIDAGGASLGLFERQLGIRRKRWVDAKVAFILKAEKGGKFDCSGASFPEMYIVGGFGEAYRGKSCMTQVSPIVNNEGINGKYFTVTVTNDDCTYIRDSKVHNDGCGCPSERLQAHTNEILCGMNSCADRLSAVKRYVGGRHPELAECLTLVKAVPGTVDILGDKLEARDSNVEMHFNKRYATLNLTKGSAAVRVAMDLVAELRKVELIKGQAQGSQAIDEDDDEDDEVEASALSYYEDVRAFLPADMALAYKRASEAAVRNGFSCADARTIYGSHPWLKHNMKEEKTDEVYAK